MMSMLRSGAGEGLERSCATRDWVRRSGPFDGVELLRAHFGGHGYSTHRHDTYAIGVTEVGVQAFDYRGQVERSLPGQVTVLHPDETHDGRAGTEGGFGYRIVYVEPARIAAAARAITGRPTALPFVRAPVLDHPRLAEAVSAAFRAPAEPLALDDLVLRLAESLVEADPSARMGGALRDLDQAALTRARELLESRRDPVRSAELEAATGLTRYELARQFRARFGTSPYRYSLLRRLDFARQRLHGGTPLVEAALTAGFADQAHFTRAFRSAYGLTPGRYTRLLAAARGSEGGVGVET